MQSLQFLFSKKNALLLGVLALVCLIGVWGYDRFSSTPAFSNQSAEKIQISASFYPLGFLAHEIGQERAEVQVITPPGSEPHDYEPSVQDILTIQNSELLLLSGELEPWGPRVIESLEPGGPFVLEVGPELMTIEEPDHHDHNPDPDHESVEADALDPHIWLSPVLMQSMAEEVTAALVAIDPEGAQIYIANQQALVEKLQQLDGEYESGLAQCQSKTFITAHESFGYLAREYNLEQRGISGVSPDSEPSLQQLAELTTFARENNVQYIFFEELVSPKLAQTLAQEVGAQTLVLNPLESLGQNQLESGENYFSVMRQNLSHLQTALACQ